MVTAALVIVSILFSIYGLMCAIECGISLIMLFPKLSKNPKQNRLLFTPIWEITNVFLVFGFTGLTILFNNAVVQLSHAVLSVLIVSLFALITRAIIGIYIFYNKNLSINKLFNLIFVLASYLVPVGFGAAGIFMITGQQFWETSTGWILISAIILGLTTLGLSFANRKPYKKDWLRQFIEILFGLWVIDLGFGLPVALQHYNSSLIGLSLSVLAVIIVVSVIGYAYMSIQKKQYHELYLYCLLISFAAPILIALANRPYLIANKISLVQAFGAQSYGWVVIIGLFVSLPILLIGFYLLVKLLKQQQRSTH